MVILWIIPIFRLDWEQEPIYQVNNKEKDERADFRGDANGFAILEGRVARGIVEQRSQRSKVMRFDRFDDLVVEN